MEKTSNRFTVRRLAVTGLLSALVFVFSWIQIPIGEVARIHLGNVFCGLSGILLGPVAGGVAGGLGAFFYDFFNPLYVAEAPITLFNKFFIGFLAGLIAHKGGHYGEKFSLNLTGAIAGNLAYTLLFYGKNFISEYFLLRLEMGQYAGSAQRLGGTDPADPYRDDDPGSHLPEGDAEVWRSQKAVPRKLRRHSRCRSPIGTE